MSQKLYQRMSHCFVEVTKATDEHVSSKYRSVLNQLIHDYLPKGNGIDAGNEFDWKSSNKDRLVINSAFHTMNDVGYYDGWFEFSVEIRASLQFGQVVDIIPRLKSKDLHSVTTYLQDVYQGAFGTIVSDEDWNDILAESIEE